MKHRLAQGLLLGVCMALTVGGSYADEGMWLFNDLPRKLLSERHQFEPTEDWAKHVQLSSVRFNSGGSASFVSSNGLVITNHHVAADTLYKLSTPENDYHSEGFLAKTQAEELKAPDLELNQLVEIEDVTDRVNQAVKQGISVEDAAKARRAVMSSIEKESLDKTGLRSDVVTLFGGGKYHLYRYKKYTDVRLVFAPEAGIAFFGGDPDNFEYPRYCLDISIFRVYENGKPAKIDHFLKWSEKGAAENELVFVSGNPGRTQRIFTVSALMYQRDKRMPYVLDFLRRREIMLQQYGYLGEEQTRRAKDELFGVQNSRKAYTGMLQGLQDPTFMATKRKQEEAMIGELKSNSKLAPYAESWRQIEDVQKRKAELIGQSGYLLCTPFEIAQTLVLLAAEDAKPSEERIRDFRDSNRESLEQQLFSPAPIYADLEEAKLADSLSLFIERRGADHPLVVKLLNGKSPQALAAAAIAGTKVHDIDFRKKLADGKQAAIDQCNDPMIQLAKVLDEEYRRLYAINEELDEKERQAYAKIGEARFAVQGTSTYPDATFTLRLAFGLVKGYSENGKPIPPWTTLGGAFEHEAAHQMRDPWLLPKSWGAAKANLNASTPFNFVCTADIIGGNSGSPVVNKAGEFVGIIFDGNIQSLTADYLYTDEVSRAVSVHSAAIKDCLKTIYNAESLAQQLGR